MTLHSSLRRRLEVGTVLHDRYEVQGVMGSGGFATVYEGFDRVIERPVAIKVMHLLGDGPDAKEDQKGYELRLKRFEREARAAARISHPNVVTIFDLGRTQHARPFIVMERLVGHNLAKEIEEHGGLTATRALPLMCRVLEAVGVGHRLGIVHRDIKPANLFLTSPGLPDENLRVLDFGLAHLGFDKARLTATHQAAGTMGYLAPEYIEQRKISPAMDVYQLCMVLVEMLTGEPVIQAENPLAAIVAHTEGKYAIPEWLRDGALGPIVLRGLALDPTQRFPDAHALLHELTKVDPDDVAPATAEISVRHLGAPTVPRPRDRSMDVTIPRPRASSIQSTPNMSADPTRRVLRPPPRRRPLPLSPLVIGMLGAFLLLASFLGAVLILTNWLVSEAEAERRAAPPVETAQAPTPPANKPDGDTPDAGGPGLVTVQVETTPSGATVREGDIVLGATPLDLVLATGSTKPVTVEFLAEGYQTRTVEVRPGDGPKVLFALTPTPAPDAGAALEAAVDAGQLDDAGDTAELAQADAETEEPPDEVDDPGKSTAGKPAARKTTRPTATKKTTSKPTPTRTPEKKKKEFVFGGSDNGARMVGSDDAKTKSKTRKPRDNNKMRIAQ